MIAAWYEKMGSAQDVLTVGEMPTPEPKQGEVLVRLRASGINPSDVKTRARVRGEMAYPRVIPHSDGAGVIEAVGRKVPKRRIDERVYVYNAAWQRPFGTAAQYVVLPDDQAASFGQAWREFEEGESPEARFARALDRLMPLLHNLNTAGRTWKENGIRKHQVLEVNAHMEKGSTRLWEYVRKKIEEAAERGDLPS